MRVLCLVVLFVAPVVLAQTAPLDEPWPLAPGNEWAFVTEEGRDLISSVGTVPDYSGVVWTVQDSVDVTRGRLPRLRIEGVTTVDCLVAEEGGVFTFRTLADDGPCAVGEEAVPYLDDDIPGFEVADGAADAVRIGGEEYDVPAASLMILEWFGVLQVRTTARVADGIGLTSFAYSIGRQSDGFDFSNATLRWASVGGEVYGQPLETREDFWPLAVGDRWEFALLELGQTPRGAITWTGVPSANGTALRLDHVEGGAIVERVTCPLTTEAASRETAWRTWYRLACDLPALYLAPNLEGEVGIWVDTVEPLASVEIGTEMVSADAARGRLQQRGWFGDSGGESSWVALRGIGVAGFRVPEASPNGRPPWQADLQFASVGGQTYGEAITTAEAPAPEAAPLAVRVGPNPVRGTATVWVTRESSGKATLEVLDALGRVVRQRPLAAGSVRLDVSDLAAGVYSVRVVAGEAVVQTRMVVAR